MKKVVSLITVCLMLFGMLAACSNGPEKIEGTPGLAYTLSEDGSHYIWTGYGTCTEKDIVIGNWHEGKPVTELGEMPTMPETGVDSITVSEGITTLAFGSLCGPSLKKVVVCDGIKVYPKAVMLMTPEMTEVVIGKGLEEITMDAFMRAAKLEPVYFRGTEAEWKAIKIDPEGNDYLLNATIVYNYKG